jgi:antitoxin YefM
MISYESTSPVEVQNGLFELLDQIIQTRQIYIINRPDGENVALIAESDLKSLVETVYLFRSRANAYWLMGALEESKAETLVPQSIDELKLELGIEQEEIEV